MPRGGSSVNAGGFRAKEAPCGGQEGDYGASVWVLVPVPPIAGTRKIEI